MCSRVIDRIKDGAIEMQKFGAAMSIESTYIQVRMKRGFYTVFHKVSYTELEFGTDNPLLSALILLDEKLRKTCG